MRKTAVKNEQSASKPLRKRVKKSIKSVADNEQSTSKPLKKQVKKLIKKDADNEQSASKPLKKQVKKSIETDASIESTAAIKKTRAIKKSRVENVASVESPKRATRTVKKKQMNDAKEIESSTPKARRTTATKTRVESTPTAKYDAKPRKAGRPKGSGKYGEKTCAVRMPASMINLVPSFVERSGMQIRLYDDRVQAGFPSPAFDSPYESLDVAKYLIPNPAATFFIRVSGESMRDAGIFPGDVLIVDRSLTPSNGDVVVAAVEGEFTVKRLFKTNQRVELRPENRRYKPIVITEDSDLIVWGVVRKVIHHV